MSEAEGNQLRNLLIKIKDWSWVVDTSNRHRVSPLIYYHLTNINGGLQSQVPDEHFEKLKHAYLFSLMVNSRLMKRLGLLLEKYDEAEIPVIILKGPALCLSVYPDPALRPFSDLDILISRDNLQKAKSLMPELGYSIIYGSYRNPDNLNEELGCEWSYIDGPNVVEVHWDLLDKLAPFDIDIKRYWDGALEKAVDGQKVLIFSPENQLLHLCLHQYKHHWENLRELVDIAGVIKTYGESIKWERILDESSRSGVGRCVYYSLYLSNQILGTKVPEKVMNDLGRTAGVGFWGSQMIKIVEDNILADHIPRRLWKLLLVNSYRDRLAVLREIVLRPFSRKQEDSRATEVGAGKLSKIRSLLHSVRVNRRFFFDSLKRVFKR
jgi:hypothetical protein